MPQDGPGAGDSFPAFDGPCATVKGDFIGPLGGVGVGEGRAANSNLVTWLHARVRDQRGSVEPALAANAEDHLAVGESS
eukprot:6144839-Pyramimonas_sp.AAC.1